MKKCISGLVATAFVASGLLSGCQSSAEKVANAQEKVSEAKQEVTIAKQELLVTQKDSVADYQETKRLYETRIKDQEKFLADFKDKIASENKAIQNRYNLKIEALEQKSNEMKIKLENYKNNGKVNWSSFKSEFNHDMDELNKAFTDLRVNNVK